MFIIMILSAFLLVGCNEKLTKISPEEDPALSMSSMLDFATVKQSIFEPRCATCHQQYASYAGVKAELNRILSSVESDRMPKGGPTLSSSQKIALRSWIEAGAPQFQGRPNIPEPEPEPEERLEPTWTSISTKIFAPKCYLCHSPNGEAKFVDFSTRESFNLIAKTLVNTEDPEASYLVEIVQDPSEPMPPPSSGVPAVTKEEVEVLVEWVRRGLP